MHPRRRLIHSCAPVLLLFDTTGAQAHHPLGGQAPQTWSEGLLSGLGHPILGLDHLLFVLGLGCLVALGLRWRNLPWAFAAAIGPGVLIHAASLSLGPHELYVALSLIVLGAALTFEQRLAREAVVSFVLLAGLLHGYAFGEAVVGSGTAPLLAYGFGLATTVLVLATAFGALLLRLGSSARWRPIAGGALAATGLAATVAAALAS